MHVAEFLHFRNCIFVLIRAFIGTTLFFGTQLFTFNLDNGTEIADALSTPFPLCGAVILNRKKNVVGAVVICPNRSVNIVEQIETIDQMFNEYETVWEAEDKKVDET